MCFPWFSKVLPEKIPTVSVSGSGEVPGPSCKGGSESVRGHFIRARSTTTRDRNLQFRGAVSTGGSPLDFLLFLQYLCAI